ncbi:unnamed protein product, partial [Ectocarpus sp. 6 AP-2014]
MKAAREKGCRQADGRRSSAASRRHRPSPSSSLRGSVPLAWEAGGVCSPGSSSRLRPAMPSTAATTGSIRPRRANKTTRTSRSWTRAMRAVLMRPPPRAAGLGEQGGYRWTTGPPLVAKRKMGVRVLRGPSVARDHRPWTELNATGLSMAATVTPRLCPNA